MTTSQSVMVHEFIARRRSPRFFEDRAVSPDVVVRLVEAARWAASARNRQPWSFLVAMRQDEAEYQRLFECLNEGNQVWAHTAPVLLLVMAQIAEDDGAPIRTGYYDTGLAVGNLTTQATAEGLLLRQMGGFDTGKAREVFAIPENYAPVTVLAIGYPGELETMPDEMREREQAPRSRKLLSEILFRGQWGNVADL